MPRLDTAALRYLGTPFHHQGRTPRRLDCAGLVIRAAHDCGLDLRPFDRKGYGREPYRGELRAAIEAALGPPIPESQWAFGCVAMMRTLAHEHHLGILAPHPEYPFSIVHACGIEEKVVQQGMTPEFQRDRLVAVYRSPC